MKRIEAIAALALLIAFTACDEDEPSTPTPPPSEPAEIAAEQTPTPEPAPQLEPEPEPLEEMDLLHGVATRLAVSTEYEDETGRIGRLFDGNMESAWNSETDDLNNPWIEFRVPDDARVSAIEMTAGFTKVNGDRDLFLLNHRVRRVTVYRNGSRVTDHELDIDNRALQRIAVDAGGGLYRIVLSSLAPGENAEWREACVSELKVIGTAPGATADSTEPTVQIGPMAQMGAEAVAHFIQGDYGEEREPSANTPAIIEILRTEGLHAADIQIAMDVIDRQPLEPKNTFRRNETDRLYCWVKLNNPDEAESEVRFRWESARTPAPDPDARLSRPSRVGDSAHWVTFAYTSGDRRPGPYRCVVVDADGEELARATFAIYDY